jgi:hypothetical protein
VEASALANAKGAGGVTNYVYLERVREETGGGLDKVGTFSMKILSHRYSRQPLSIGQPRIYGRWRV